MLHLCNTVQPILPISMDCNASTVINNSSISQLWSAWPHQMALNTTTICTILFPYSKINRLTSKPTISWHLDCWLTLPWLTANLRLLFSTALLAFSVHSHLSCLMFQARSVSHARALKSSITLLINAKKEPMFSSQPISTNLLPLLKFQLTITKKNSWIK